MQRISRHLTYANVVASLALFSALGGGAYAAGVARNSVGSAQVRDHSLKRADFRKSALPKAIKGPAGTKGDAGATGADGAKGLQGVRGVQGATGPAGTAVAYGYVGSDGGTPDYRWKNLEHVTVTHPGTGQYCIKGNGIAIHNLVASMSGYGAAGFDYSPQVIVGDPSSAFRNCAMGDSGVFVYDRVADALVDASFYVLVN